jgi:hypothetical protein
VNKKPASYYDDWVYIGKETYGSRHVSSRATIKHLVNAFFYITLSIYKRSLYVSRINKGFRLLNT